MEEIAHLTLGHPPSRLCVGPDGFSVVRSYSDTVELEAYDVGAACLVPYAPLFRRIRYDGVQIAELSGVFAVKEPGFCVKAGAARVI